jgi:tetratricopeptide (TPR) repeat protein
MLCGRDSNGYSEAASKPVTTAFATLESLAIDASSFPSADAHQTTRPTIVATTLTGNSRELIGDALRSVIDWVDWCLVIDTGVTDDTIELARAVAGGKLVIRKFPWANDFAKARNFALDAATEIGADWAMTLDTDERILLNSVDVHAVLQMTEIDTVRVWKQGGDYAKERFFRLPAVGRWVGPTHEAFMQSVRGTVDLEGASFTELPKSSEQLKQKLMRDVAILNRYSAEHPEDGRWFYYLGDSYDALGRKEEAISTFRRCSEIAAPDEEGAWAMYRAAQCLLELNRPDEAIAAIGAGMARHAGLGELPWLAGYAAWQAGRADQAAYWAFVAITLGKYSGVGDIVQRRGFCHEPGLWEGPFDILRFALRKLGDDAGADDAEHNYHEAKAARLARHKNQT